MPLSKNTGVKIDITDEGIVSVCGVDKDMIDKAIEVYQDYCNRFRRRNDS